MQEKFFLQNGIDADTGLPLSEPLAASRVAALARGETVDEELQSDLSLRRKTDDEIARGLREGLEARDLAQAGWGIVFAQDDPEAAKIREALEPLLKRREDQAVHFRSHFFKVLEGRHGYKPGMTKHEFLAHFGAAPGPADPDNLPYYLLLVGSPERIPFRFQHQLDVEYAVGRLHFDEHDNYEKYRKYAQAVVDAEEQAAEVSAKQRRAVFFGIENVDDEPTQGSSRDMVGPLAGSLYAPNWTFEMVRGRGATKTRLAGWLGGKDTPDLLFTAGHGIGFQRGHDRQLSHQGALLCSEWLGKGHGATRNTYFCADDLASEASLAGLISFHFACYSAGTPTHDEFAHQTPERSRLEIAARPFVASLAQKMLAAGALAVVGHIDRSFEAASQVAVFTDTYRRLLAGYPVGAAIEPINQKHAALAAELVYCLEDHAVDKKGDLADAKLAQLWTANHDARAYTILGDPAVRVPGSWEPRR